MRRGRRDRRRDGRRLRGGRGAGLDGEGEGWALSDDTQLTLATCKALLPDGLTGAGSIRRATVRGLLRRGVPIGGEDSGGAPPAVVLPRVDRRFVPSQEGASSEVPKNHVAGWK